MILVRYWCLPRTTVQGPEAYGWQRNFIAGLLQERPGAAEAAKSHHSLDASPVVPGPVEQNHFAGGGDMIHITLEIPFAGLALGRFGQGNDPHDPGVHMLAQQVRNRRYSAVV